MGLLARTRIPRYRKGDRLRHEHVNELVRLADREIRGIDVMSDAMGTMIWHRRPAGVRLCRLMLAEDHPGWGEVFMCYKGRWNSVTTCWDFECDDDCDDWVYAIDWFWAGEGFAFYPDAGATGVFWAHPSKSFGTIWEAISMDCESKGACGTAEYCAGTYTGTCSGTGT